MKRIFLVLAIVFLFCGLLVAKLPALMQFAIVKATKELNINLSMGEISAKNWFTIAIQDVNFAAPDNFVRGQAKEIRCKLSLLSLLQGRLPISMIDLIDPGIHIEAKPNEGGDTEIPEWIHKLPDLRFVNASVTATTSDTIIRLPQLSGQIRTHSRRLEIQTILHDLEFEHQQQSLKLGRVEIAAALPKGKFGRPIELVADVYDLTVPKENGRALASLHHASAALEVEFLKGQSGYQIGGTASFKGLQIEDVLIESFFGRIRADSTLAHIEPAVVHMGGTPIFASVDIELFSQFNFGAALEAQRFSIYDLVYDLGEPNAWVDLLIDTEVKGHGQLWPFHFSGQATGEANDLWVSDKDARVAGNDDLILATARPVQFVVNLDVDTEAFRFVDAVLTDGISKAQANCDLLFNDDGMKLFASFEHFDFASIGNQLAHQSYFGSGQLEGSIEGPYENLIIEAPVAVNDLVYSGFALGSAVGHLRYEDEILELLNMNLQKDSSIYGGSLQLSFKQPEIFIDAKIQTAKALAENLRAIVSPDETSGALVFLRDFDLVGPIGAQVNLAGPIKANLLDALEGSISLTWQNANLFDETLNPGRAHFMFSQDSIRLDSTEIKTNDAHFEFAASLLRQSSEITGSAAGKNIRLAKWFGETRFDGSVSLAGSIGQPQTEGTLTARRGETTVNLAFQNGEDLILKQFEAVNGGYRATLTNECRLRFANGALDIPGLTLIDDFGGNLRLAGRFSTDELKLKVDIISSLQWFPAIFSSVERASGRVSAELMISGTYFKPSFYGQIKVDQAAFAIKTIEPQIENIYLRLALTGNEAVVAAFHGETERGFFDINGQLGIDGLEIKSYDLALKLSSFKLQRADSFAATTSGTMQLAGSQNKSILSGQLDFDELLISHELDMSKIGGTSVPKQMQAMALNLRLATSNAMVRNESVNAELRGDVRFLGTIGKPGLRGSVAVVAGDAYIQDNRYRIRKGRIDFDDAHGIVPIVDLEAETQIDEYDVTAQLQGPVEKPTVVLRSQPPLPDSEIWSLIGLGLTRRDLNDVTATAAVASWQLISQYTGVVKRLISSFAEDGLQYGPKYRSDFRLTTLYSQKKGVHLPAISIGASFGSGFRVRLQNAIADNGAGGVERQVQIEQDMTPRLRWRFSWDSHGDSNLGDIGMDLWYRWEF